MKKLLIATDSFLPRWDGISRFLTELIPALSEKYDVTVIAPDFPGNKVNTKAKIVRIPLSWIRIGDYTFPKRKKKIIRKHLKEADLVFSQTIGPIGRNTINCAEKMGLPVACYIHSIEWELASGSISRPYLSFIIKKIVKFTAKKAYDKANLILVPSKEVKRIFEKEGIGADKKVVYLGINPEKFLPAKNKKDAKTRIGINPSNLVIGFHGRIGREKDLMTLYNSFNKLARENRNIRLLIVGSGLSQQETLFRSSPNVKYVRSTDQVIDFLQAIDIYVLPSLTETTSLSTLEAMSCGCAVLATRVGLVKKYIKDRVNGSFFPAGNEHVLYLKMKWLADNPAIRNSMGYNARDTILRRFNWKKTGTEIEKALESLL